LQKPLEILMFRTLGIAQKLAVAAMLFLAPVCYVLVALVTNQNTTIAFSEKERVGTLYLRQLAKVHEELAGAALGNGKGSGNGAGSASSAMEWKAPNWRKRPPRPYAP
jgi:methyl-accepting chemotaxis protein